MHEIISSVKRDYIEDLAKQDKRVDGRALDQFREVSVEKGVIKTASGSARVKVGDSQVLVGVKIEHAEPFPDRPESGVLIVNAELSPVASPTFEARRPGEDAIELARVVDRGVRESETIDLGKLLITSGEDVWAVFIDVYVLDHGGNLIDASALAAMTALLNVKPPEDEDWTLPEFPLSKRPVMVTVSKINGKLMVDPSLDEENVAYARISISTTEDGSICAIQKGGTGYLSREEVEQAYELSRAKGAELRKYME